MVVFLWFVQQHCIAKHAPRAWLLIKCCIGLILSGTATILFSTSSTLPLFAALWFMNGFSQGAGWPACAKLLKKVSLNWTTYTVIIIIDFFKLSFQWFSPEQFGTFWSALSASSNISGSLCPFIAAWVITQYDWRASLALSGKWNQMEYFLHSYLLFFFLKLESLWLVLSWWVCSYGTVLWKLDSTVNLHRKLPKRRTMITMGIPPPPKWLGKIWSVRRSCGSWE